MTVRIAIAGGTGRMGRALLGEAADREWPVTAVSVDGFGEAADGFDVLVDFTAVEASLQYLELCRRYGKGMVIGTTGFDDGQLADILMAAIHIPIVLSPNMSLGVNLCLQLLRQAAAGLEGAEIAVHETHHRNKKDAPSGTALQMARVMAGAAGISPATIPISSHRLGGAVGEHRVVFSVPGERIEISHRALQRSVFAVGALRAAAWLDGRAPGLYSMQDVLGLDAPERDDLGGAD